MYLKCILESVWCSHFRKMPRIVKRRCPTSWIQFCSLAANRYSFVGSMWIAIDNRRYLEILSSLQEDGFSDVISRCAQMLFCSHDKKGRNADTAEYLSTGREGLKTENTWTHNWREKQKNQEEEKTLSAKYTFWGLWNMC
jgi:hypothetical protein